MDFGDWYRNAGLDIMDKSRDGEGLSMFHLKHLLLSDVKDSERNSFETT